MDLTSFRVAYPEFQFAPDALVTAKIAEAVLTVSPISWGVRTDLGVGLWTAHLLTMTPQGRDLRLKADSNKSPYSERFIALQDLAGFGPVVV